MIHKIGRSDVNILNGVGYGEAPAFSTISSDYVQNTQRSQISGRRNGLGRGKAKGHSLGQGYINIYE